MSHPDFVTTINPIGCTHKKDSTEVRPYIDPTITGVNSSMTPLPLYLPTIETLLPTQPAGWDMWLLGCHGWRFKGKPLGPTLKGWQSVQEFTGAHAYVLSRRGAEILVADPFPIETHIEYYICGCSLVKGLKIVKHSDLRIGYAAEITEADDSDTFDTRKSCPVCVVPDTMLEDGFYMSYWKMWRATVGLAALGAVAVGAFLGAKRKA